MNKKYTLFFFYGRILTEKVKLIKQENTIFKDIDGKSFNNLQEAIDFLQDYKDIPHSFKDIGVAHPSNQKYMAVSATSVEKLLIRLERINKKG